VNTPLASIISQHTAGINHHVGVAINQYGNHVRQPCVPTHELALAYTIAY